MTELPKVDIFTDGACRGNPGPGGWAALILRSGAKEKEIAGGEPLTTNNRMELKAAIEGLNALTKPCRVELHTDSVYVRDGITKWIHGWLRNGWRTADKKPVKNAELWQELLDATARHEQYVAMLLPRAEATYCSMCHGGSASKAAAGE